MECAHLPRKYYKTTQLFEATSNDNGQRAFISNYFIQEKIINIMNNYSKIHVHITCLIGFRGENSLTCMINIINAHHYRNANTFKNKPAKQPQYMAFINQYG